MTNVSKTRFIVQDWDYDNNAYVDMAECYAFNDAKQIFDFQRRCCKDKAFKNKREAVRVIKTLRKFHPLESFRFIKDIVYSTEIMVAK
jgi:hypothetical protein